MEIKMKKKGTLKTLICLLIALAVIINGCAIDENNVSMDELNTAESIEVVDSEMAELDIKDSLILEPMAAFDSEEEMADAMEQSRTYTHDSSWTLLSGHRYVVLAQLTSSGQSWYGTDNNVYLSCLNEGMYELLFKIPGSGGNLSAGSEQYFLYELPHYSANFVIEYYPSKLYISGSDAWKVEALRIVDFVERDPNRGYRSWYLSTYENHFNGIVLDKYDAKYTPYTYFMPDLWGRFTYSPPNSDKFGAY